MSSRTTFSRNFLYNIAGALLPIIVSLGTVPFYIQQIGLARYGVVTISWVLLGYFGFLDFGLSRATANVLAKLGHATPRERSPVLMTAFYCNLCLGLVAGLVMYGIGYLVLLHLVKIPGDLLPETRQAFPWMAAMLPLGMLAGITTGALESREKFLLSNTLGSFGAMAGQVLPLICCYVIGPRLDVVIPATLITRLVVVVLTYGIVIRLEWPLRLLDFDMTWLRKLVGYGSWVSISSLLNPILDTSNQLIVGATLGVAAVAGYSVPMTLAMRTQVVATALSRTLFPRLSRLSHMEALDSLQRATRSLAYGFGMVCGPAILFSGAFLRIWIGPHFQATSQTVAQILMFGAWTNGVAFLPYSFLQARGRPHITATVGLFEVIPFFAVLWLAIERFGLPGAALAWTLRVSINCILLFVLSGAVGRETLMLVPGILMMLASLIVALLIPMSIATAALAAAIVGLVFAVMTYVLDPTLRTTSQRLGRKLLRSR